MYNIRDLKWLCMILGTTNMEGIWCIYCYLCKMQWKDYEHRHGTKRTIENMEEYLNIDLEGAARKGVVNTSW